jgi:hypothetical protein
MAERLRGKNISAQQETSEGRYARLRAEVQSWIEREQEKKRAMIEGGGMEKTGIRYDPHTDRINPLHLTESDLDFWQKIQNPRHSQSIFKALAVYDAELDKLNDLEASSYSRYSFRAAMVNQIKVPMREGGSRGKTSRPKKPQ